MGQSKGPLPFLSMWFWARKSSWNGIFTLNFCFSYTLLRNVKEGFLFFPAVRNACFSSSKSVVHRPCVQVTLSLFPGLAQHNDPPVDQGVFQQFDSPLGFTVVKAEARPSWQAALSSWASHPRSSAWQLGSFPASQDSCIPVSSSLFSEIYRLPSSIMLLRVMVSQQWWHQGTWVAVWALSTQLVHRVVIPSKLHWCRLLKIQHLTWFSELCIGSLWIF